MSSINKVILIGNLGADPETKQLQTGCIANLRVATSESWKDKQTGERKEKTEWHSVSVLNPALVDVCEKYLRKGSKVYIEGQLETRKWQDKETGQDRYATQISVKPFNGGIRILSNQEKVGSSDAAREDYSTEQQPFDDAIPF